jgi:hypothetical protein
MYAFTSMPIIFIIIINSKESEDVGRGTDKSLAFPIFLFVGQPKEFFLEGLKKLEQRSHNCVELREEYVNTFFQFRSLLSSL